MVWTNLAAAYLGKLPFATPERQERAISAFEQALALEPHTPHVSYNLGLIYMARNDLANALRCFDQHAGRRSERPRCAKLAGQKSATARSKLLSCKDSA